ncbi:hypothetical protein MAP00_004343 [Monascus purpureus]|nr:hypothetical protein MAP00_004343 [Monascus purpureus]
MVLPDFFSTTVPNTMPGVSPEQHDPFLPMSSLKKRKRDSVQEEVVNLAHPTVFSPSSCQPFNSAIRLNCPELNNNFSLPTPIYTTSCVGEELSLRPRCLPRKRRVLQQPSLHHQQYQQSAGSVRASSNPTASQSKFLSHNVSVPTSRDLCSPPVSPKTLIPISYQPQQQQQQSTSATALRPCHICHRRPTTREVLDAYADCDLCGERACYICLRQCDSIYCCGAADPVGGKDRNFHPGDNLGTPQECLSEDGLGCRQKRKVCSWCAVEGVTDTGLEVVRCLDCVRDQLSQWQGVPPGQVIPVRNRI